MSNTTKAAQSLACVAVGFTLSACAITLRQRPQTGENTTEPTCEPVPMGFDPSDLVGTWTAEYGDPTRRDKLVLNSDGTYTQTFTDENTGYEFESGKNAWWVEELEPEGFHVHLANMMFCDLEEECIRPEVEANEGPFFDVCQGRAVALEGELILSVVGDKRFPGIPAAPRGVALLHMRPPGRVGPPFRFVLEAP